MTEPAPAQPTFPRGVLILLGAAGAVVTIAGIRAMAALIGPVFLALMLVVTVRPVVARLQGRGLPRWAATLCTLFLLYALLIALGTTLAVSVARLATILPDYADNAAGLVDTLRQRLQDLGVGAVPASQIAEQADLGKILDALASLLAAIAGLLSNLVFLLALLFFMGIDAVGYPHRLTGVAGTRPGVVTALVTFARGTRHYLAVTSLFGLIVAAADTLALGLLGVPLPILWGLVSFITNYIPNVGFVIGLIPPALLALLDGGWQNMLVVIAVYCAINFVIQGIIQPRVIGDSVGLSVTMTFLALTFWAWVLGPLGALLAVPLTLLTKALLVDIDPGTRWINILTAPRPPPPDLPAPAHPVQADRPDHGRATPHR